MNAEDTVMAKEQAYKISNYETYFFLEPYLQAQAEISFRAGMDRLVAECRTQAELSFKSGIKEVAEWVEKNSGLFKDRGESEVMLIAKQWQAKLKEWGVDET